MINLEQLRRYVDKKTFLEVHITTPEESGRIRDYFSRLGQPYKTVIKGNSVIVTTGKI